MDDELEFQSEVADQIDELIRQSKLATLKQRDKEANDAPDHDNSGSDKLD